MVPAAGGALGDDRGYLEEIFVDVGAERFLYFSDDITLRVSFIKSSREESLTMV
jgi:hypothetical protein